jgi:hypothetical protein
MSISPIKFLGLTVLSFNTQLGLGSSETTLSVDLVRDCAAGDAPFGPNVGGPVYFAAGAFSFGGVLTNWTKTQGGSGQTYNIRAVDPRQLLENFMVIVDSYIDRPIVSTNYFNAYAYYESEVLNANCQVFGLSRSNQRGMPYSKIIQALRTANPVLRSPTNYQYSINWDSFPSGIPEWYRVVGPGVTLLQLLQDVCDVTGFEFYVNLLPGNIITVGLINLKIQPPSFSNIINAYDGYATDISYGQELRNDITKTVLFGERQHYLSQVYQFNHFFGEDNYGGQLVPVIPYGYDECGFLINKKVESLNLSLTRPLGSNGPYTIHELDIRCAMASEELWKSRAMSESVAGSLNAAVRANWPEASTNLDGAVSDLITNQGAALGATLGVSNGNIPVNDMMQQSRNRSVKSNEDIIAEDLQKVWNFVKSLGETYYGKQFLSPLNQYICWYQADENSEKTFSDEPTNAGGWIDPGFSVLGLSEPELTLFRSDDERLGCFAIFNTGGDNPPSNDGSAYSPEIQNMQDLPDAPPPLSQNALPA